MIDTPADCDEVARWLDDFPEVDRSRVLLMPQGTQREELAERELWLAAYCLEQGWPIARGGRSNGSAWCGGREGEGFRPQAIGDRFLMSA